MKKKIFIVFSLLFILISVLPKENVFAKDLDGLKIEEELRGPVSEWIPYEVKSKYNEEKRIWRRVYSDGHWYEGYLDYDGVYIDRDSNVTYYYRGALFLAD